jgi:hypothetical protein
MEGAAKTGDAWQKTKADCIENLKNLYPHIKPSDMKTIVTSIFALLKVTENVEAQHTKKRAPRKMSEKRKEKNDAFKAKKNQEAADRKEARQTPPAADQQKQATTEESSEKAAEKPQRMYDARPFGPHKM